MLRTIKRVSLTSATLLVSSLVLASGDVVHQSDASTEAAALAGKTAFAQCGACHLATGEGVKGAFPPLRNRVANLSSTSQGRVYLQSVLLQGLIGKITVDDVSYNGYMQAYGSIFNDQQISAVLNYMALNLVDEASAEFNPYTPAEVSATRTLLKADGKTSNELRKDAID